MESTSYRRPARVGFEIVKSSSSPPVASISRWASVKRLGVSFQPVRRENMERHDTRAMTRTFSIRKGVAKRRIMGRFDLYGQSHAVRTPTSRAHVAPRNRNCLRSLEQGSRPGTAGQEDYPPGDRRARLRHATECG